MSRVTAIVQVAVYDAVNGIERRYKPIHVQPAARPDASKHAAAVQAAYATLLSFYPAQKAMLDEKRADSLANVPGGSRGISRGVEWGQKVADAILAWRSTDGFAPPPPAFMGGTDPGVWRPTPPGNLPGAGPQFATMVPWSITSPDQFQPDGPPALGSVGYDADRHETEIMGDINSAARTEDQTLYARFWAASTASYYWNQIALSIDHNRHSLIRKARLLALVNVAMADAAIACWNAKYKYVFWRPVTAIDLEVNPAWTPLLTTPNHPEYPSGHSTVSAAAATVLRDYFGEFAPFQVTSDVMPDVERTFPNFTSALEEIKNARIYAGIHFRSACRDGEATGTAVARWVLDHTAQLDHGGDDD